MNLTIKQLPEEVCRGLKAPAAAQGRSRNSEVVQVLSAAAREAERRQSMRASRAELERFVTGLPPLPGSVRLIRQDRQR